LTFIVSIREAQNFDTSKTKMNKTGDASYNGTMRRVGVIIVAVEKE
jgi:hypothetical protein